MPEADHKLPASPYKRNYACCEDEWSLRLSRPSRWDGSWYGLHAACNSMLNLLSETSNSYCSASSSNHVHVRSNRSKLFCAPWDKCQIYLWQQVPRTNGGAGGSWHSLYSLQNLKQRVEEIVQKNCLSHNFQQPKWKVMDSMKMTNCMTWWGCYLAKNIDWLSEGHACRLVPSWMCILKQGVSAFIFEMPNKKG